MYGPPCDRQPLFESFMFQAEMINFFNSQMMGTPAFECTFDRLKRFALVKVRLNIPSNL